MDPAQPVSNGATPEAQVGPASDSRADVPAPVSPPTAVRGRNGHADDARWSDERRWGTLSDEPGDTGAVPSVVGEATTPDVADGDDARPPEVLDHVYQPLLQHLEAECRRVLAAADTEAEKVRSKAQDEARRILTEAHRERSAVFRRASSKQALMYEEAESEIQRWLAELDDERQSVLETAHDDAARLLRVAAQQADADARERLEAADREAQAIVAEARLVAAKYRGPALVPPEGGSTGDVEARRTPVTTGAWSPRAADVAPAPAAPSPPQTQQQPQPPALVVGAPPPNRVLADVEVPPPVADQAPPVAPPPAAPPVAEVTVEETPTAAAPVVEVPVAPVVVPEERPTDVAWMTAEPEAAVAVASPAAIDPIAAVFDAAPLGAPAPVAAGSATVESLSRRERRSRRRFGLGKSGH